MPADSTPFIKYHIMKKNLLQPESKEEIIMRINKLTAQSQREWGKMNVNQMLYHTAAGLKMAYGEITSAPKGNWLSKKLMRYVIFNTDMPTPKGKAETFPEVNTVALGIHPPDFNIEKNKLIDMVKNFPSKPLHPVSALLGDMTKENWARLHYTHLDHHLKQFGV
jgi:hypothetical protein